MIRYLKRVMTSLISRIYGGIKVTVYMKSGNVVKFRCKKCNFDTEADKITGYTIEKHNNNRLWISSGQIEAIIIGF